MHLAKNLYMDLVASKDHTRYSRVLFEVMEKVSDEELTTILSPHIWFGRHWLFQHGVVAFNMAFDMPDPGLEVAEVAAYEDEGMYTEAASVASRGCPRVIDSRAHSRAAKVAGGRNGREKATLFVRPKK